MMWTKFRLLLQLAAKMLFFDFIGDLLCSELFGIITRKIN